MNTTVTTTLGAACAALLFITGLSGHAEIWGVKSQNVSATPVTLFHYSESGSGFQIVAAVKLGGTEIVVDGLAMSADDRLFAFQLGSGDSRLITIDKDTASAAAAGPFLAGRDIRGAVIAQSGQLIVLDVAQSVLLEVSLLSGTLLRVSVPLTTNGAPFTLSNGCDIAQRRDGAFIVASYNTFYQLDIATGVLTALHTDTTPQGDDLPVFIAGLAVSSVPSALHTLFVYDVNGEDDLYTYQPDFTRSMLITNIIASYNAGRGDLAARTPEPLLLLTIELRCAGLCADVCWDSAATKSYQLEYTSDFTTSTWEPLGPPVQGTGARICVTETVRTHSQRFYRLQELP